MDPNKKAETVATSFVPEGIPAVPGLTPEQLKTRARARELRGIYDKTKDTDPMAALRRPEAGAVSTINTDKEAERRITDPTILGEVKTWAAEAKVIAEEGLDTVGITATRKQEIIDAYVTQVLDSRPEFQKLKAEEKRAIAEAKLRSPEVRAKLGKLLSEKFSPTASVETPVDTDLKTKKAEKDQLRDNKTEVAADIRKTNKSIADLKDLQTEHQPGNAKFTEIQNLVTGLKPFTTIENHIRTLQPVLGADGFARLKSEVLTKKNAGITLFTDANEIMMDEIIQYELDSQKLNALIEERDGIGDKIKDAEKQLKKLEKKRKGINRDISDKDDEIDELDDKVEEREIKFWTEMETIIIDAGNEDLEEEAQKRFEAFEEQYKKETKAASDGDIQRLRENLQATFTSRELRRGRPREVNRNAAIQTAWNNALMSGDAAHPALAELRRTIDTSTPEGDAEFTRIQERFENDSAFRTQLEDEYVTYLFQKRIQVGRPMFEGEARLVDRYGWGKYVDKAITQNNELQGRLQRMTGSVGEASYYQRLRSEYGDNWLSILALLAVGAVIPGTMMARMVRQETGR